MRLLASNLKIDMCWDINNSVDLELFVLLEAFINLQIIKEINDFRKDNYFKDFHIIKIIELMLLVMPKIEDLCNVIIIEI
jgi:hypothetical protein